MANYFGALVIKHNNDVYLTPEGVVGTTMVIPTPGADGVIDGDYWAVPITDFGLFTGFDFVPTSSTTLTPPAPGAFHVFRLTNLDRYDVWYVRGTTSLSGGSPATNGYIQVSRSVECCDLVPLTLPTTIPAIAGCYTMCDFNADGLYFAMFGLPILTGTLPRYYPYGYYNGTALTSASATGYATTATLLTFLNTSWSAVGTWTIVNNALSVTQAAGTGTAVLCVNVIAISPSA